jgi:hypothetical protein
MPDILDRISLKGAAFCLETGDFADAEEMLADLSPAASASPAAAALRRRIRDAEIAFWQARHRFASIVAARFPNYLLGRLYADLCSRSRENRQESDDQLLHICHSHSLAEIRNPKFASMFDWRRAFYGENLVV